MPLSRANKPVCLHGLWQLDLQSTVGHIPGHTGMGTGGGKRLVGQNFTSARTKEASAKGGAAHKLTHGRTAREINGDAGFVCRVSVCELKSNG